VVLWNLEPINTLKKTNIGFYPEVAHSIIPNTTIHCHTFQLIAFQRRLVSEESPSHCESPAKLGTSHVRAPRQVVLNLLDLIT